MVNKCLAPANQAKETEALRLDLDWNVKVLFAVRKVMCGMESIRTDLHDGIDTEWHSA